MKQFHRIAGVDSWELLSSRILERTLFLTSPASPVRPVLEAAAGKSVRVLPWVKRANLLSHDEDVLTAPKTTALLRKEKVDAVWLSDWSSPTLEAWAKENGWQLLSARYEDQSRLENKFRFDAFAREQKLPVPDGGIVGTIKEAEKMGIFPCVLQRSIGHGAMGTFFAASPEALPALPFGPEPFLLRRYVEGLPFGVTVLIGPERTMFSALRVQLFWITDTKKNPYLGVQWVPRSRLPQKAIAHVEDTMKRLCDALRAKGYCGTVNIDGVLAEDRMTVIECNPRLSAASSQLIARPELFHGTDFAAEFVGLFEGKDLSLDAPTIPESTYEGTTIDLDILEKSVKNIPPSGKYEMQGSKLTPSRSGQGLALYAVPVEHDAPTLGYAYSDASVAEISGLTFALHENGHNLIESLRSLLAS
ncbi:MAG: ATP-grasp domain-containing protein [Candidatus Peribacteraceae bacterium]|nr:ATP-grasp domain-containing protein [Candidatus Peribacteraceae bacterium]